MSDLNSNAPQTAPNDPLEKQRRNLRRANKAIGIGCTGIMLLGGIFFMIMVAGITFSLFFPTLVVCLLVVPAVYALYVRKPKCKWLLYPARAAAYALIAVMLLSPVVCICFQHTPLMYPVKRLVFTKGVRKPEITDTLLPFLLPARHDDYFFRTEPSMIAQDYTPFAYLAIHTDAETLRAYEAGLTGNSHLERRENPKYTKDDPEGVSLNDDAINAGYLPMFVYQYIKRGTNLTDDLTHAVIYQGDNSGTWHCGSGALINYETGLLIVWI